MSVDKVAQLESQGKKLKESIQNNEPSARPPTEHEQTEHTCVDHSNNTLQGEGANPATPDTGQQYSPLARALLKLAAQRKAKQKEAKKNRLWRNVSEYHTKQKEKLKHRPARAKDDGMRAYCKRVIRNAQTSAQPTPPPRRSTGIRFAEELMEKQIFQQHKPVTSIPKATSVQPLPIAKRTQSILGPKQNEFTLTAAKTKFIHEDTWHQVKPGARHSTPSTRPTARQVRDVLQRHHNPDPSPTPEQ